MHAKTRKNIRDKARLTGGLVSVLNDDIFVLREHANTCDVDKLNEALFATNETIEKITDALAQIEYALYLDSRKTH